MKKAQKLLLLTFGLVFFTGFSADSQTQRNLDFSGFEQFLLIGSILEQDREPKQEEWDRLFETPGYEILTHSEFSRDFFKRNFRLVFMPSQSQELKKTLKEEAGQPPHVQFVNHFLEAKQNREELIRYTDSLRADADSFVTISARMAKAYLPPGDWTQFIPLSFLIFANDARGYTPVVIDIFFAKALGENLPVLIAHELHHFYRNKILVFDMDEVTSDQQDLLWVMNQIQAEGIADQIDKRILIMDKEGPMHAYADSWEAMVSQAPEYIQSFDKQLAAINESLQGTKEAGQKLKTGLPMSGHPIGFFMANTILEQGSKKDLVEKAGNPFAFFRLYHKAAQNAKGIAPTFSHETLQIIEILENKYVFTTPE